ncbi:MULTISPECIES: hypothetical protein [unclassified Microcoleus]|uniref:hypothetical protein n=1 Tax=unclassified Microcoleus TaxID=2642155 RepID=UPI002FCEC9D2
MDNSVRPNLRYCIIKKKEEGRRKKEEGRRKKEEGYKGFAQGEKKEEGSSATDSVTDVTDFKKKEEGRRKRE